MTQSSGKSDGSGGLNRFTIFSSTHGANASARAIRAGTINLAKLISTKA